MIGTVDGPVFCDAEDTSGQTKDAELVADIISKCIDHVGAENVVLVVTDNAANCKIAGVFPLFRNSIHSPVNGTCECPSAT